MPPRLQPYAAQHAHLAGPGDARPTAKQVVQDQDLITATSSPETARVILITGGTSAIGVETARALHLTGARIYITARDAEKGATVAKDIVAGHAETLPGIEVLPLSLDSLASVRAGAARFLKCEKRLDVLVLNAGIMACPEGRTEDGFETHLATNHLGHFLLFRLLARAMERETEDEPARVVVLSSSAHRACGAEGLAKAFGDWDFAQVGYNPVLAYGRSKLANIYFANELTRRYSARGIYGLSVHPGSIKSPLQKFIKDSDYYRKATAGEGYQAQVKSAEQGAATTVWAVVAKELKGRGAMYLENVGEGVLAAPDVVGYGTGYSPAAFGRTKDEEKLWEESDRMCGIQEEVES